MSQFTAENGQEYGVIRQGWNGNFDELYGKAYAFCYIDEMGTAVTTSLTDTALWYEIQGTYVCHLEEGFTAGATSLVCNTAGDFFISVSYNFSATKASDVKFGIKVNDVLQAPKTIRRISNSGDVGSCTLLFGIALVPTDEIQLVANSDTASNTLQTYAIQAAIHRVGQ